MATEVETGDSVQLSRLAASWLAEERPPPWRELDGSWLLADLSGFTRLTEVLTGRGNEGVEVLHEVLTQGFGALLGRALELGGDVLGLAGDAALLRFSGPEHQRRAVVAAAGMPRELALIPAKSTGGVRLRVSVGVHCGRVSAVLTDHSQRGLIYCGPEMSSLVRLEGAARPGQVLMSQQMARALPATWSGRPAGAGVQLDRRAVRGALGDVGPAASDHGPKVGGSGSSGAIESEHRSVSIGFVAVPGLDELMAAHGVQSVHSVLSDVAASIALVADEAAIEWLDTDVGVDSVKFLLAAGAPRAVDDDEGRLLWALRRIIDTCQVPVRAGAQRGRVFAGPLGVPARHGYTVLGDPVNVAARVLGLAGDRDLVVGDGFAVERRASVDAVPSGSTFLKNRVVAMDVWRVRRADRSWTARSLGSMHEIIVGVRAAEWEEIASAWKRTVDRSHEAATVSVVSVIGEPGMGAPALLDEAASLAGAASTSIIVDRFRRHVPFAAVRTIVRSLGERWTSGSDADVGGDQNVEQVGWDRLEAAAQELPAHLRGWSDVAFRSVRGEGDVDDRTDPRMHAIRTRVVMAALLVEVLPSPGLLVIDGFDDLDAASAGVFGELIETTPTGSLMVLSSSSDRRTLPSVSSTSPGRGEVIELPPLDGATAAEVAVQVAPELRADEVDRIVRAAAGNLLVLVELAAARRSVGEVPDSLQRLAAVVIDGLDDHVRSAVLDASILGRTWSIATAAAVLDRPELGDPGAWSSAQGVLRDGHDGTMSFRHDAARIVANETLTFRRRRELHAVVADHLGAQPGVNAAELAVHLEGAGRWSEAVPVARSAGLAAKSSGALVEAADLLDRAIAMARRRDVEATDDVLGELLVERGQVLVWLGDLDAASRSYAAANRRVLGGRRQAELCHLQADLALTRSRYRTATSWIRRGLAVTDEFGDGAADVRCRLLLDDAAVALYLGRHEASLRTARNALDLATRVGSDVHRGLAHLHLEMVFSVLMDEAALEHGERAIEIFESIGHDRYLDSALVNSGLTAMHLGRWDDAIERYTRGAELAKLWGLNLDVAVAELNIGFVILRRGRSEEAGRLASRSLRVSETVGVESLVAYARVLLAMVAIEQGNFDGAAALLAAARDAFERSSDAAMVSDCDTVRMDLLGRQGRWDEVILLADQVAPTLRSAEVPVRVAHARHLGRAELMLGDPAGRDRIFDALDSARRHGLVFDEYLCLDALVRSGTTAGLPTPRELIDARDAIARQLGIESEVD